ncbi:hypothetical protein DWB61_13955 [Ancylomarina euxinus]|uniref:Lipoprotein n=1 Tax=Ancylomarina euxinus TaxID=2283627 RepID=A0A425XYD5_9BACT|nr:hypothetical protein [Ancylomarina euxinus]MCZ4695811.1 hypothetical protein [Ancylomarina euxinus]MUP16126.1 hypothetical protein [Ancylomarina euxinus]RRG19846.1 hypothetical protein DWB61_13955 [Ancylomarina euxinus]
MRNIILFSLLGLLILVSSCSSLPALQSSWNRTSSINNSLDEKEANVFFHEDKLTLKLSNDANYLDIIIASNSPLTLNKIYNLGLSVWLDPQGKNKQIFGVNFPLPVEKPYSRTAFQNYISRLDSNQLQEELFDRFQKYEYEDVRLRENIRVSTLDQDEACQVRLNSNDQILFSYHIRISLKKLMGSDFKISGKEKIGISLFSTTMATEAYLSSLSSKEVINKRLNRLKAGDDPNRQELVEKWINFGLATDD